MSKDLGKIGVYCSCGKPLRCRKYPDAEEGIEQIGSIYCSDCISASSSLADILLKDAEKLQNQADMHTISIDNSNSSSNSDDNAYVLGTSTNNETKYQVSTRTLHNLRKEGKLKNGIQYFYLGKQIRYKSNELQQYFETSTLTY